MRKSVVLKCLTILLLTAGSVVAENYVDKVLEGNRAFKAGDNKKALEFYHSAETDLPESPELEYNIAGALHQDGGYEEAVEKYQKALNSTDINLEAQAHYNLGNTLFRMQDYQNAIQSYQKSLGINPDDMDAKYNLELARRMLKEQMEKQEKDTEDQQEKQEQEEEQEQEEQQDKQDQGEDEQQQDQQQQDQESKEDEQQKQPQPQDEQQMSKEDAERILNAMRDDESDIQKKIKRRKVAGNYAGKDW